MFRWIDCTDKTRPRRPERAPQIKLRLAHLTDPHMPGDIPLAGKLRDLMRPHRDLSHLSHELSAISNEFSQPYRKRRRVYVNLLKKALVGLQQLQVDHLLLTGDLAHCGMPTEFLEVKAALDVTGWRGPERLTVIAGNHDRFNLYEDVAHQPMEDFFDVVQSRAPRVRVLPGGVALWELDSNSDRLADRHAMERWLPNTIGRIYPEAIEALDAQREAIAGCRLIVLIHHHLSIDWYPQTTAKKFGGLMNPLIGADALLALARQVDPHALVCHGHIHDVMPLGYTYGPHQVSCPGGFAEHLRVNLIDVDLNDQLTLTQLALRH